MTAILLQTLFKIELCVPCHSASADSKTNIHHVPPLCVWVGVSCMCVGGVCSLVHSVVTRASHQIRKCRGESCAVSCCRRAHKLPRSYRRSTLTTRTLSAAVPCAAPTPHNHTSSRLPYHQPQNKYGLLSADPCKSDLVPHWLTHCRQSIAINHFYLLHTPATHTVNSLDLLILMSVNLHKSNLQT